MLDRGAAPDIFIAARLGDVPLADRLIASNPASVAARINQPGYDAVPPFNIYCWTLGFGMSPHAVALKYGHSDVYDTLWRHSSPAVRLLDAASRGDEARAREALAQDPSLPGSLTAADHAQLAFAIFHGRFDAADLMLRLGFDPRAGGVDGGSALHAAAWMGHVGLVERLLARGDVGIESRDPQHESTPLGWAAFGSVHRRAKEGDYVGVIDRLVAAGANIGVPGNGGNETYLGMAEGNDEVQQALRRHGARSWSNSRTNRRARRTRRTKDVSAGDPNLLRRRGILHAGSTKDVADRVVRLVAGEFVDAIVVVFDERHGYGPRRSCRRSDPRWSRCS